MNRSHASDNRVKSSTRSCLTHSLDDVLLSSDSCRTISMRARYAQVKAMFVNEQIYLLTRDSELSCRVGMVLGPVSVEDKF